MRPHRALTALAILVALLGVPAVAATASPLADDLDPLVVYEGEGETVATDGVSSPVHLQVTVDCSTQPCRVAAVASNSADTASLTGKTTYALTNGHFEADIPAVGDICADDYTPPIHTAIDITAVSAHLQVTGGSSGEVDCADGSTIEYDAGTIDATLPYISGSVCLLDASCNNPSATPLSSSGPFPSYPPRPPADPGVLSTLATPSQAITVANVIWAAAGSVVLVLLVALPTALFDSAIERLTAGRAPREKKLRMRFTRWPYAVAGLGVAAIAATFVDPRVGLDVAGLRTLTEITLALAVSIGVGWVVLMQIARRLHPSSPIALEFRPVTLVVVIGAVLFSRLTGFEPGIVFGLVAGVVVGGLLATVEQARLALIGLGWSLAAGILSWIGYGLLPATGGTVFVRETLSAVAVAGISAMPIALLPLRGLTGNAVWAANKILWAVAYLAGLFAFLLVLLPLPSSWDRVQVDLWGWIGLYLAYAVAALGLWLFVIRPWRRDAAPAAQAESTQFDSTGANS
ncbi:MAG: hypothetical protein ABIR17_04725 [Pseudolysinimonas sp.]|uniref:hypothetical protein n=1 Tax=Pseudolysinimonas sp. TaxID=2680009 RepID=UPI00326558CF